MALGAVSPASAQPSEEPALILPCTQGEGSATNCLVREPPERRPPPPPPSPVCETDETPAIAEGAIVASEIAHVIPHIRWCTNTTTGQRTIEKFADISVVPKTVFFQNWEYVGGIAQPFIDGEGFGRYIQSIKITTGVAVEIDGNKKGLLSSCIMTIDRRYALRSLEIRDNLGDCQSLQSTLIGEAAYTSIPEPGAVSYPPVELVWLEPSPIEVTDVIIHTTMEVVEFSWETDIIDSPIGDGGEGGDPEWGEYFVSEADEVLA